MNTLARFACNVLHNTWLGVQVVSHMGFCYYFVMPNRESEEAVLESVTQWLFVSSNRANMGGGSL